MRRSCFIFLYMFSLSPSPHTHLATIECFMDFSIEMFVSVCVCVASLVTLKRYMN